MRSTFDEIRLGLPDGRSSTAFVAGAEDAPPVLLLHGFPDTSRSWRHQLPELAAAGYRPVAPLLRGYEPSSQLSSGGTRAYHPWNVATDALAHAASIDRGSGVHLVGHDWGAVVAYLAAAREPDRFVTLTTLAVPAIQRPERALRILPAQIRKSWYMFFFQLRLIAERSVVRNDWAFIANRWHDWSPGWTPEPGELEAVTDQLGTDGVLEAALAYYRAFFNLALDESRRTMRALGQPIPVPHLAVTGATDGCIDTRTYDCVIDPALFPAGVRIERIDQAGHFVHQERPAEVNALLLAFLAGHGAAAG